MARALEATSEAGGIVLLPKFDPRTDPKRANLLFHDAAAPSYDRKWAISFDRRSISYVADRAAWMLPAHRYARVLDVGVGTGFFLLNLWQAGFVEEPHGCDLSPGMLAACAENARRIGCDVRLRTGDAEDLPYADGSFDLVVGHAFLHHVPDPGRALAEARRVLAPGGALFVAGEPTVTGDRLAKATGRLTHRALKGLSRVVRPLRRPPPRPPANEEERIRRELEWHVDLHTFELDRVESAAREAGFADVRIETEELLSSVFGWMVRTIESLAPPGLLGDQWAAAAYRGYLALYRIDRSLLYPVVPKGVFHHFLLFGERGG
jgi:ubiquinone/menaquinone biosynthesis C-methylase UbiE